ncbi:MAG: hypothetical protein KJN77_04945 [Gammaproteobacteria bacterium]|nr:hypothetical protein [Gammaproteobacteria bacterium]
MQFQGPTTDDLENVFALNRHFLRALMRPGALRCATADVRRLSQAQRIRLAEAPFLLFSVREQDHALWQGIFAENPQLDLAPAPRPFDDVVRELQTAGLSFLWQLSRRNAYAARVVSGAPVDFCERLANATLIKLLRRTADHVDLLVPRYDAEHEVWRRLTSSGVSATRRLQLMTQQSALQNLLTRGQLLQQEPLPAAASRFATRPKSRRGGTAVER